MPTTAATIGGVDGARAQPGDERAVELQHVDGKRRR